MLMMTILKLCVKQFCSYFAKVSIHKGTCCDDVKQGQTSSCVGCIGSMLREKYLHKKWIET